MPNAKSVEALMRLIETVAILRSPGGCPWDAEQTPESLKPYIIEEAYEVIDAIDQGDTHDIREELGDLLLQVVLQSRIFEERNLFTLKDVAIGIAEKLERRHPHVFGPLQKDKIQDIERQWEHIKQQEKEQRGQTPTTLGTLPAQLPALMKARKISQRASQAGFDWPTIEGVMAKVHEELSECEEAIQGTGHHKIEDELGDLLFSVVNLGRFLNIDAEEALDKTIKRFTKRFTHVEKSLKDQNRSMDGASFDELITLWQQAKQLERGNL